VAAQRGSEAFDEQSAEWTVMRSIVLILHWGPSQMLLPVATAQPRAFFAAPKRCACVPVCASPNFSIRAP